MYGVNNFEINIVKISIVDCVAVELLCPRLFMPQSAAELIHVLLFSIESGLQHKKLTTDRRCVQ